MWILMVFSSLYKWAAANVFVSRQDWMAALQELWMIMDAPLIIQVILTAGTIRRSVYLYHKMNPENTQEVRS